MKENSVLFMAFFFNTYVEIPLVSLSLEFLYLWSKLDQFCIKKTRRI